VPTTAPLLLAFLAACLVQLAGGLLLIWPRSSGFAVVPVGMLLSAPFWWGFDLPLAWLNAALALPLLAAAWPCTGKSHVIRARAADPQPATIGKPLCLRHSALYARVTRHSNPAIDDR
jgi:hypothetical protein